MSSLDDVMPRDSLGDVVRAVSVAVADISTLLATGTMLGPAEAVNSQGEVQQRLDLAADQAVTAAARRCGQVAVVASEEQESPGAVTPGAPHVLVFDPLDGSSNVDVQGGVGTIFSVLPGLNRPGTEQQAAGFALYGPATVLVISLGKGVDVFTLDRATRTFHRTGEGLRIQAESDDYAINGANERFWGEPVRRYVADCRAGREGPRGRDTNTRWPAALVADAYRILTRGGVYLYPADTRPGMGAGRLRLLYECAPIAFLVEQAGGAASTGHEPVLPKQARTLHERTPFVFGSVAEVERIERLHRQHSFDASLFNRRSLYRPAR